MPDITPELFALADLADCGLFDAAFYRRRYPDLPPRLPPVLHYFAYGAAENRAPNAYFDPDWYRANHAPGDLSGVNLLLHYMRVGEAADHRPSPLFDTAWYRAAYGVQTDPLADFLRNRRTRAPLPGLWAIPRIEPYRDLPDPVAEYAAAQPDAAAPPNPDAAIIRASGLFDENFYLINGTDVLEASLDPVEHFCAYGVAEGRNPNFYFDTKFYLRTNPALVRQGVNPLVHYWLEGEQAGRRPVAWFDPAWYRARYGVARDALGHWLVHRRGQTLSPTPLFDVARYMARHGSVIGRNRDPFAHYLQAGITQDIDPSPPFDAAAYRRTTLGRPSKHFRRFLAPETDNPFIHHLVSEYR